EVVAFNDELESLMTELEPATRRVLELRLQGNSQPEIAHLLGISDRTVRRRLNEIRTAMTGRLSRFGVIVPHQIPDLTADKKPKAPRIKPVETEPLNLSERVTVSDLDFSIERFLGGGGFGRVFFARRKRDGQIFALKFLRKQFLASSRAVRALLDEAEFVAKLSHPGIVQVRDVGQTARGHLFLVMDYIAGNSLREFSLTFTHSLIEKLQITRRILEILSAVHAAGIVHCDLKPDNVLIDQAGQVILTDFGLARRAEERERSSDPPAGTVAYMAPEQLESAFGSISPATDLYSLGMILFELLTGRTLFQNASLPDMISEIISPRELDRIASGFHTSTPIELIRLLEICLARDPNSRPASAEQIRTTLDAMIKSLEN
ncbi:MAG TPA: protein kinase, partial [Planctomycetaceae bacterium]|nr:protein kinase [Planctomycetaceae bacterium]